MFLSRLIVSGLCVVILAGCGLNLLDAQDNLPRNDVLLKDIKEDAATWNTGFCVLGSDSELSAATAALARSLPTLWRAAFTADLNHALSEQDRLDAARLLLETARNKARQDISNMIEDRDKAWLAGTLTMDQDTDYSTKEGALRAKLAGLLRLTPDLVTIAPRRKINLVEQEKDKPLFEAIAPGDANAPDKLAQAKKLQTVVYGNISQEKDYIFLRLYVWDSIKRRVVWQTSQALRADEAEARVEDQIEGMASALLGYAVAGLIVQADPEGTLIVLRPTAATGVLYRDIGKANFRFLEPGEYSLYLKADGYEAIEQKLTLEPGKTITRSAMLVRSEVKYISVESDPSGAAVYLFSRYQGKTPMTIPLPEDRTTLILELPGYQKQQVTVGPDSSDPISVPLMRDILNWSNEIKIRRDRFYESLGWFALSCLPPILFNGLYQNSVSSYQLYGGVGMYNQAVLYYRLYLGTFVLTGVALIDTALKLSSYLEAADYLSGRN